ncbi:MULTISPECIES: hypothetical protein [Brevibacillus]|uniref:hypothetical protein n=1 Tax=Brevibacillus TaxID=55080 RepID=UPI001F30D1DF|nr:MULTISPECIES: hypothetical protein [Brevibacillus]MED1790923.1 hypothetical protein [Brevibacillus laterosporus]
MGHQGAGTYVAEGAYLGQEQKEEHSPSFKTIDFLQEEKEDIIDFRSGIPV